MWGKMERADAPRDDDYFEATLVEYGKTVPVRIVIRLTARHGMDIKAALARMVDLPQLASMIALCCSRSWLDFGP